MLGFSNFFSVFQKTVQRKPKYYVLRAPIYTKFATRNPPLKFIVGARFSEEMVKLVRRHKNKKHTSLQNLYLPSHAQNLKQKKNFDLFIFYILLLRYYIVRQLRTHFYRKPSSVLKTPRRNIILYISQTSYTSSDIIL